MGRAVDVFVAPVDRSLRSGVEAVADEVGRILGTVTQAPKAPEDAFVLKTEHVFVGVEPAVGYEDDRDMPMSEFDIVVHVENRRVPESMGKGHDRAVGRLIFDKLRETSRYSLLLTEDMQKLLDRFSP